jgi:hypothetical protein
MHITVLGICQEKCIDSVTLKMYTLSCTNVHKRNKFQQQKPPCEMSEIKTDHALD